MSSQPSNSNPATAMEEVVCRRMKCPICNAILKEEEVENHSKWCNKEVLERGKGLIGKYITWETWGGGRVFGKVLKVRGCVADMWTVHIRKNECGELDRTFGNVSDHKIVGTDEVSIDDLIDLFQKELDKYRDNAIRILKGVRLRSYGGTEVVGDE